jgi:hypothetical protein
MDMVKTAVEECKKNGMKVWIEGDCGYPDGFAGGLISRDYPLLGMQGIVSDAHCTVAAGETLDIPLPVDTLGLVANPRPAAPPPAADAPVPESKEMPLPADGIFKYAVPRGGAGELTVQLPNAELRYSLSVGEPFSIPVPPGTKAISLRSGGGGGGGRGRGGRGGGGGGGGWRRRAHGGAAARGRTSEMDGACRHGVVGAYLYPARLPHLAHTQRQWGGWRRHQGQSLLAD